MLYKKICTVALSLYAFLPSPIHGSTYYVSSNPSSNYQCPSDITSCHIYCDKEDSKSSNIYNCNNVQNCYFYCDRLKCGANSVVNASNANILTITQSSNGQECMHSATVTAPYTGSAYLTTNSKKGFKSMNVYAGPNTKEIIIDTTSGQNDGKDKEYESLNVYASTADYLRINIGSDLQWIYGTIECPVNSSYNGPDPAPCMIDATNGKIKDTNIIAPDGAPDNVYIEGCKDCNNVQLICDHIDVLNGAESGVSTYPFNSASHCWWSSDPTKAPTMQPTPPTNAPTFSPTRSPTHPTQNPSNSPSSAPSSPPTMAPSTAPSLAPSNAPSSAPTMAPSKAPSLAPSKAPSSAPTMTPSKAPSLAPSKAPSSAPTLAPSKAPSLAPSKAPSSAPTLAPTTTPTLAPSRSPTQPTQDPTAAPTQPPSNAPSSAPSFIPTDAPSTSPTAAPTQYPSKAPSFSPTMVPSKAPSLAPSKTPSFAPTLAPSNAPSDVPTNAPSNDPTRSPSVTPTSSPSTPPTNAPSFSPSLTPTTTPTTSPSTSPSVAPSSTPTSSPSASPSIAPSFSPSDAPTNVPTFSPSDTPSNAPTYSPTSTPTAPPTISPTYSPTIAPTPSPTLAPTRSPSIAPTTNPTNFPSFSPTKTPTSAPSQTPTNPPTNPSHSPTNAPSISPSNAPSLSPTFPSMSPTQSPSNSPTEMEALMVEGTIFLVLMFFIICIFVMICLLASWFANDYYKKRRKQENAHVRSVSDMTEVVEIKHKTDETRRPPQVLARTIAALAAMKAERNIKALKANKKEDVKLDDILPELPVPMEDRMYNSVVGAAFDVNDKKDLFDKPMLNMEGIAQNELGDIGESDSDSDGLWTNPVDEKAVDTAGGDLDQNQEHKRETLGSDVPVVYEKGEDVEYERTIRVEKLRAWMQNVVKLNEYTHLLVMNGYDSLESLREITLKDLKEMGIDKMWHRRQIFRFVEELNV